jgi:hypothetical protein
VRLAAERGPRLLLDDDHLAAGIGELGSSDQAGKAGSDDDHIRIERHAPSHRRIPVAVELAEKSPDRKSVDPAAFQVPAKRPASVLRDLTLGADALKICRRMVTKDLGTHRRCSS